MGRSTQLAGTLTTDLGTLLASYQRDLSGAVTSVNNAYSTATEELGGVLALAVLLALGLGWFLAHSIVEPLAEVQRAVESVQRLCMTSLARGMQAFRKGDLTVAAVAGTTPPRHVGRDEIGQTAEAVRGVIGKVQQTVADYETARAELATMIGQVARSSQEVYSGSTQLAQATQQVGEASTQISRAIEDVARGASAQNTRNTEMLQTVGELDVAVHQVEAGADEQSATAKPLKIALDDMSTALIAAKESLSTVTQAATQASQTAQDGGQVVDQTVTSIGRVSSAVRAECRAGRSPGAAQRGNRADCAGHRRYRRPDQSPGPERGD